MDIHLKNYLKNFIPYGPYCHNYGGSGWCPFYKSTWNNTIKNYKRTRKECDFQDVCDENCSICNEVVSYCLFLNTIEYGDFPLGDGCKSCYEKDIHILDAEELGEKIEEDIMANFYTNVFENIKNKGVNK